MRAERTIGKSGAAGPSLGDVSQRRNGYLFVLVAAVCFGTQGMFSQFYFDAGGEPFGLLFLRFVATAPILLAIALLRGDRLPALPATAAGLGLGVLLFGVTYALFEGFDRAPVSLVVLLFFIYPLLVTLGAVLLLGEEFGLVRGIILGVGILGIALTIGVPGSAPLAGIVAGILAGVLTAGVILGARTVMTRWPTSPLMLTALMFMGPAIVLALIAPATSLDLGVNTSGWAAAAGAVLVSGVLAIAFFVTGLKLIDAGSAALLGVLEPLVAVLLAVAVLGESLSGVQLLGGAVILIAVAMIGLQMMRPG